MKGKEIAKFFCGFEAFHTLFHGYLWTSGRAFTAFGIDVTPTTNMVGVVVSAGMVLVLGFCGWDIRAPKNK